MNEKQLNAYAVRTEIAMKRYHASLDKMRPTLALGDGLTMGHVMARLKTTKGPAQTFLSKAVQHKLLFSNRRGIQTRYFLSVEDLAVWMKAEAEAKALALQRSIERQKERSQPRAAMPATPGRKPASGAFRNSDARRPDHVKVQHCPCGMDTRFTVPPTYRGDFSRLGVGRYLEA